MALMERVSTLLRANLNDLIDRAEDPAKMIKQVILDMENQLMQVKTQVAIAVADLHVLERKRGEDSEKESSWMRKADLAVARKDDTTWVPAARNNVGVAPMPAGPSGKGFTFVGGSNLMMFKNTKHPNEAWALMKYLSGDAVQKEYANLMGMFPARLAPQKQVGQTDPDHEAFYSAIQQGRTYAPIPQWAQIENAYKNRLGAILDSAAGEGKAPYSARSLEAQLKVAAKEADALLAQNAG